MQTILNGFIHERMVRNADWSGEVFAACHLVGKDGGEQVVRAHTLDGWRHSPATLKPQNRERLLYWEQYRFNRQKNDLILDSLAYAGRYGDWKAVRPTAGAALELYDLKSDPAEANNVAAVHPEIVRKLEPMLKAAHQPPRTHSTGSFDFVD